MRMQQHFTAIASLERAHSLPVLLELRSCSSNRNIGYSKYLLSFLDISTSSSEKLSSTWIIWRTTASRRLPSCSASAVPVYVRRSLRNRDTRDRTCTGMHSSERMSLHLAEPTQVSVVDWCGWFATIARWNRAEWDQARVRPRIWSTLHAV